jgi:hypothetical protein
MGDTKTIIEQVHSAFNKRDIDGAFALMKGTGIPAGGFESQKCDPYRDP